VIRFLFCNICWVLLAVPTALIGFPALYITGSVEVLWNMSMWAARTGYTLVGIRVRVVGREKIEGERGYLFMANHVSNLDPPVITNQLGRRIAYIAKKELFSIPLFGRAMRAASFICMDRKNKRAAIDSVQDAVTVLRSGLGMMVFPEGTRSPDGRLLHFKKGPFHLAISAGVPVVPITVAGTYEAMPKGKMRMHAGEVVVTFHSPLDPVQFANREELMEAVRAAIESALPEQYRSTAAAPVS
jgi:1-acyl-sn-glycerol-3-phosphate acyltransferase